jgi:chemotaxis signal transduction protein
MSQRPVSSGTSLDGSHIHYLEQLNDQEFWHHAAELAAIPPPPTRTIDEYLECDLEYGREQGLALLPLASLREVVTATPRFTQLPSSPQWMPGLTAWRGEPIAVIDLAAFLSQKQARIRPDKLLLIAQYEHITLGLYATVLGSLAAFPAEQIQPLNTQTTQALQHCIDAIQGIYANALILHLPTILTTMVHHLQVASYE